MSAVALGRRFREALPRGRELPPDVFRSRHRGILVILWAHVPAIAIFAVYRGFDVIHSIAEAGVVAALALAASTDRIARKVRSALAAAGLVTASAVLVHLSDGLIEMHFHFFVVLGLMTLYQDWAPYGVALGYVVVHHGVMGGLTPDAVFNHPAALANPWLWAAIHGGFVLAACVVQLFTWRANETEHLRTEDLRLQLHEGHMRRRQALQINDSIVQALVVAQFAHAVDRSEEAEDALKAALFAARSIISDLVGDGSAPGAVMPGDLVHATSGLPEGAAP